MTAIPRPRLPDPLTPEALRDLMRERAYWDLKDSRSRLYHHAVRRGFEILYPGPGKTDGIGRMIRPDPKLPSEVAHQVVAINREIDQLERVINGEASPARDGGFDERPSGEGVHVQSHTRDGGKTEVADYWRAAPGQGGANGSGRSADTDSGDDTDSPSPPTSPTNAHVAPDPEKLAREWSGTWQGESEECVALVKKAVPGVGATPTWREGEKLKGPGDPPLEPGTAIATFENGKYPNRPTGNHAAIVIEPGVVNGKEGYWVLDQHQNQPTRRTFLSFDDSKKSLIYRGESYSTIRKKP